MSKQKSNQDLTPEEAMVGVTIEDSKGNLIEPKDTRNEEIELEPLDGDEE